MWRQLQLFLRLTQTHGILRRYFVVNGFDGALAMLGLLVGFYVSPAVATDIVATACLGTAIALGVSGLSSAYISEAAEMRKSLAELEDAMAQDLAASAHARAARFVPLLVAAVNGLAPLLIGLVVSMPLWLAGQGLPLPLTPVQAAMAVAFLIVFLLGVFLGHVGGTSWWGAGIKAVLIALGTVLLIFLLG